MATKKLRTPLIKPRVQGGTFYTFSSALEDIGLNINELKNKVSLSHYVVLNIPAFNFSKYTKSELPDSANIGDYQFAEVFQNYALNFETVLRNQNTYNFSESLTVSERVFWKFMQHYELIEFEKDSSSNYYFIKDTEDEKQPVVKGFGLINAGAQRTDAYGIYNETFVQIPSSYGKMKVLFKPVLDKNYNLNEFYQSSHCDDSLDKNDEDKREREAKIGLIENVDNDDYDHNTSTLVTKISAQAQYDTDSTSCVYNVDKAEDALCIEFSLDKLREYYTNYYDENKEAISYDDIGIEGLGIDKDDDEISSYNFNAILVYYSIYDSTGKNILATNLYGILILDSAREITRNDKIFYEFPTLTKKQTTATVSGSSYAFRLNVKASSIYTGNVVVNDESTASFAMATEFTDVIRNLSVAIETLKSNANVIQTIASDNKELKTFAANTIDKVNDLEKDIASLKIGTGEKNITANSVTTNSLGVNNIYVPSEGISIYNNGNINGSIDSSTFYYKNIESTNSKIDTLDASIINGQNGQILFTDKNNICGKITNNGIFTNSGLYIKNEKIQTGGISEEDIDAILNDTSIGYDSNRHLCIYLPEIDKNESLGTELTKYIYEESSGINSEGFDYYNLKNLVLILVAAYQNLNKKIDNAE